MGWVFSYILIKQSPGWNNSMGWKITKNLLIIPALLLETHSMFALTILSIPNKKKINEQNLLHFFFLKHLWSIYIYSEYWNSKKKSFTLFHKYPTHTSKSHWSPVTGSPLASADI